MESRRIHSNDKLVKFDDGKFAYFDSYGERFDFIDGDQFICWAIDEEMVIDDDLDNWIKGE